VIVGCYSSVPRRELLGNNMGIFFFLSNITDGR